MPSNMQKKPKVANLELEPDTVIDSVAQDDDVDIASLEKDDYRYVTALRLLEYGNSTKKITAKLVKDGVFESRVEAMRLAERVKRENPQTERTNAYIQFGAGAVFIIAGLVAVVPAVISGGISAIVTPSLLLFLIAGWFFYKGMQTFRDTGL